ncbi:MAG: TetR/AcrR family transcriptional regulator [Solirubrobacterales bacterium]|nr:TetR/AcrR family transcriptional regulator [Solirubrobacterales bacterium]HRV60353.1 TetR/AcrR family transcriptional regulator [Solirubrobacterales bacterium]
MSRECKRVRPTRAETRDRLLDSAARVFSKKGFAQASLDDVAADAGLTKGAVYSSFESKDALFFALMKKRIDQRLELIESLGRESQDSMPEAIDRFAEMGRAQDDWHLLFIEFWSRAVRDPDLHADFVRHRRAARASIARLLQVQSEKLGISLPASPDDLAVGLLALSNGMAIERIGDPEEIDEHQFSLAVRLLLRPATGRQ